MYRVPSRRRSKEDAKLNLVPIMDAIFIFIFFLLISASLLKMYEIPSDIPIISNNEPPPDKKPPLALTLRLTPQNVQIVTGVPGITFKTITNDVDGKIDLISLHNEMIEIKKRHLDERTIILEPHKDLSYNEIIQVMDAVKILSPTDPELFSKDKDGINVSVKELFGNIIFGNIQD